MAKRITGEISNGVISIMLFLFILWSTSLQACPQSQKLTQPEFSEELSAAISNNNYLLADSLIRTNRLFVKPFVNDLIKVIINRELKGKTTEAGQLKVMANKVSASFENTFREKNLKIGVGYLTTWTKEH